MEGSPKQTVVGFAWIDLLVFIEVVEYDVGIHQSVQLAPNAVAGVTRDDGAGVVVDKEEAATEARFADERRMFRAGTFLPEWRQPVQPQNDGLSRIRR